MVVRFISPIPLEAVTQGELHYSRVGKSRCVVAETGRVSQCQISLSIAAGDRLQSCGIESYRVCDVKCLPAESQGRRFGHVPGLAEPQIETEVTGAANVVALSGLAGQGEAECVNCRRRVLEYVGTAIDHERSAFRLRSDEYGIGGVLPICRPIIAVINSRGESAAHAIDPG